MTVLEIFVEIAEPFRQQVNASLLESAAQETLLACGRPDAALSILVVDDETSRAYNRDYRQVDAPTDVLSFAAQEGDVSYPAMPPALAEILARELGDLILAFPYAAEKARSFGHSLAAELQLLVVHGTLHLLGYDHDTDIRQTAMWQKQSEILAALTPEDLSRRLDGQE